MNKSAPPANTDRKEHDQTSSMYFFLLNCKTQAELKNPVASIWKLNWLEVKVVEKEHKHKAVDLNGIFLVQPNDQIIIFFFFAVFC